MTRAWLKWAVPLVAACGVALAPLGLDYPAHAMAALTVATVGFWLLEPIPLPATALLAPAVACVLGLGSVRSIFSAFADPVVFLFLGGFFIARAMEVHGCDLRLAHRLLRIPGIRGRVGATLTTLVGVTAFLSMWLSNTATTLVMLPLATGLAPKLFGPGRSAHQAPLLLAIAYGASIGGIGTPVGSPPNAIALGLLNQVPGIQISFLDWMLLALPIQLALLAALLWWLRGRLGGDWRRRFSPDTSAPAPLSSEQWATYLLGCLAVVLWLAPDLAKLAGFAQSSLWLREHLPEAVVALLVASALFIWPLGRDSKLLSWKEAAKIDWGTLLLFGGGLALGKLLFDTGLGAGLAALLPSSTGSGWAALWFLICLVSFAILMTEIASNTAMANLLLPLTLVTAGAASISPTLPVVSVAIACSLAFCLPVASPPNAIVYGSGLVPLSQMVRAGWRMNLIAGLVTVGVMFLRWGE